MAVKPDLQVNVHDAKTNLSRYLARVASGETVVIAKGGTPIARLVPFEPDASDRRWFFGSLRDGEGSAPENFDRWMEDEIAELFEGPADEAR